MSWEWRHKTCGYLQKPSSTVHCWTPIWTPKSSFLRGQHFNTGDKVKLTVLGWFRHTDIPFYAEAFKALVTCWDKCNREGCRKIDAFSIPWNVCFHFINLVWLEDPARHQLNGSTDWSSRKATGEKRKSVLINIRKKITCVEIKTSICLGVWLKKPKNTTSHI